MTALESARRNIHRHLSNGSIRRGLVAEKLGKTQRPFIRQVIAEMLYSGTVIERDGLLVLTGEKYDGDVKTFGEGDPESYLAVHQRLRRTRGRASLHSCECGSPATNWSYNKNDPDELFGETKSGRGDSRAYSVDLANYAPRCYSCHTIFDS